MKTKTVWEDWWTASDAHRAYGYDGANRDEVSILCGYGADIRWMNMWGKTCKDLELESDGKIIGDE